MTCRPFVDNAMACFTHMMYIMLYCVTNACTHNVLLHSYNNTAQRPHLYYWQSHTGTCTTSLARLINSSLMIHYSCYSPSVLSFPSLSSTIHTYHVQLSVGEYHIATKHCHCTMLFHTLWILTLQDSRAKAIYVPKLIPRLRTYMYMYMYTETHHFVLTAHWWLSYLSVTQNTYSWLWYTRDGLAS